MVRARARARVTVTVRVRVGLGVRVRGRVPHRERARRQRKGDHLARARREAHLGDIGRYREMWGDVGRPPGSRPL